MRYFRVAWVILAVVVLALDAAGIPYAYTYYADVCTLDAQTCFDEGLLTPEGARELGELGLSRGFYAAHDVVLSTVVTLVCFAVAAVIFLRRSDDGMALFTWSCSCSSVGPGRRARCRNSSGPSHVLVSC